MSAATTGTFSGALDRFLLNAATTWKNFKDFKKSAEPAMTAIDALDKTNQALQGTLPAYSSGVEKLRTYVAALKDKLMNLARKDENYWMERSDLNSLNPQT